MARRLQLPNLVDLCLGHVGHASGDGGLQGRDLHEQFVQVLVERVEGFGFLFGGAGVRFRRCERPGGCGVFLHRGHQFQR